MYPNHCATPPQPCTADASAKVAAAPRTRSAATQRIADSLFKFAYRWTHARAYRHNERLWRGVTIGRDARGFLNHMSIDDRAIPLANDERLEHASDACHLIATGASVNDIDYAALDLRSVMGVNGAVALQDRQPMRFDYYCMIDWGFVSKRPDLVARVIAQDLLLFTTPLVLWHIARQFSPEQLKCRVFLIDNVLFPAHRRAVTMGDLFAAEFANGLAGGIGREAASGIASGLPDRVAAKGTSNAAGPRLVPFSERHGLGFSLDIRRGIFDGRTVAYAGLQVLTWLGFDTIYLHGIDLCNAATTPRFYETRASMQPTALDEHFEHFIEPSFRQAATLLAARGVDVFNLSEHSALAGDIFPRLDWQALRQPLVA